MNQKDILKMLNYTRIGIQIQIWHIATINLMWHNLATRGGQTALFIPLTFINMHANASNRKRKIVRKVFIFRCIQKFKLGELWPAYSQSHETALHWKHWTVTDQSAVSMTSATVKGAWSDFWKTLLTTALDRIPKHTCSQSVVRGRVL